MNSIMKKILIGITFFGGAAPGICADYFLSLSDSNATYSYAVASNSGTSQKYIWSTTFPTTVRCQEYTAWNGDYPSVECRKLSAVSDGVVVRSCLVNGQPYIKGGATGKGGTVQLYALYNPGATGGAGRMVIEDGPTVIPFPSGTSTYKVFLGIGVGLTLPSSIYTAPELTVSCVVDGAATAGVGINPSSPPSATMTLTINITNSAFIAVSTPPHMVTPPGGHAKTDFTISQYTTGLNLPFTWEVGLPCSDWNPYLTVNGTGTAIASGGVDTGVTSGRTTPVSAHFTAPNTLGDFTCLGTMTFMVE